MCVYACVCVCVCVCVYVSIFMCVLRVMYVCERKEMQCVV